MSYDIGIVALPLSPDLDAAWEVFDRLYGQQGEPASEIVAFCAILTETYPPSTGAVATPTDIWAFYPILAGFRRSAGLLHFRYAEAFTSAVLDDIVELALAHGLSVLAESVHNP